MKEASKEKMLWLHVCEKCADWRSCGGKTITKWGIGSFEPGEAQQKNSKDQAGAPGQDRPVSREAHVVLWDGQRDGPTVPAC